MKQMKKNRKEHIIQTIILLLLIVVIWLALCIEKGLVPFGEHLIDAGDMGEQSEPLYLHLWDVLHGKKAFYFDWYTSLGCNMAGVDWHFGLISPFNVFFLFIPRNLVVASMPYYILIKLLVMGICIDFVLFRWLPGLDSIIRRALALLYVFCVFNAEYYRAPMWLDVACIFPIVMYGLFQLLLNGKRQIFLWSLTMTAMMSFQHTYMLALMILLITGILFFVDKKISKKFTLLLGTTLQAMALTAIVWIPGILQIASSKRVGHNGNIWDVWESVWLIYPDKWFKLINLGIPIAFILYYIIKNREKRASLFFGGMLSFLLIPFLFEGSNILWHGGSYQGYPVRFGYMVAFWLIIAGGYAVERMEERKGAFVFGTLSFACLLLVFFIQMQPNSKAKIELIFACILGEIVAGFLLCIAGKQKMKVILAAYAVVQAIILVSNCWIYAEDIGGNCVTICEKVEEKKKELINSDTPIDRIKSKSIITNNYPLAMQEAAISSYLAVASQEEQNMLVSLGYASVGDRLTDYGGTLFSDMVMGIKSIFSTEEENDVLYTRTGQVDQWKFYQSKYKYELGILLENEGEINWREGNVFANQNQLAELITGEELFNVKEENSNCISIITQPNSVLYLYSPQMRDVRTITVYCEDNRKTKIMKLHESGWNNGIQELGVWDGEKVDISVEGEVEIDSLQAATLALDQLVEKQPQYGDVSEIAFGYQDVFININSSQNAELFLPIYAQNGWHCKVNGIKTDLRSKAGFLAIPIENGENLVQLQYSSPGKKLGTIISIIGLIWSGLGILWKQKKCNVMERESRILNIGFIFLWVIIIFVIYIMPIIGTGIFIIKGI